MIASAWRSTIQPTSVGWMAFRPWPRSSSGAPTARSSAAICWLIADCVYPSRAAARLNEPSSPTAFSATRWRTSTPGHISTAVINFPDILLVLIPAGGSNAPVAARGLSPTIGVVQGTALYLGAVLGAGVLILPGAAATIAGPASVVSWTFLSLLGLPLA